MWLGLKSWQQQRQRVAARCVLTCASPDSEVGTCFSHSQEEDQDQLVSKQWSGQAGKLDEGTLRSSH